MNIRPESSIHETDEEGRHRPYRRSLRYLRAAVVELPSLSDAQPSRPEHQSLLDLRLRRRRLALGEVDRAAVSALGRVQEHVEQELRVGGSSLDKEKPRNGGGGVERES